MLKSDFINFNSLVHSHTFASYLNFRPKKLSLSEEGAAAGSAGSGLSPQ